MDWNNNNDYTLENLSKGKSKGKGNNFFPYSQRDCQYAGRGDIFHGNAYSPSNTPIYYKNIRERAKATTTIVLATARATTL